MGQNLLNRSYKLDEWDLIPSKFLFLLLHQDQCLEPILSITPGDSSLKIKQPECEGGHLHPSSANTKNMGSFSSIHPITSEHGAYTHGHLPFTGISFTGGTFDMILSILGEEV
jgi:hypothetical protein